MDASCKYTNIFIYFCNTEGNSESDQVIISGIPQKSMVENSQQKEKSIYCGNGE